MDHISETSWGEGDDSAITQLRLHHARILPAWTPAGRAWLEPWASAWRRNLGKWLGLHGSGAGCTRWTDWSQLSAHSNVT